MKIPLSWLKEYIDIDQNPSQIAKTLTMAGLEVDAIEKVAIGCQKVVVCKVIEIQKHPQADKLCLATVFDGQQTHQVVCGASNCRVGLKTALALIGATVFDEDGKPFKLKKAKIRGVESSGMLCSLIEIGIKDTAEGIVEFSDYLKEGTDVAELYGDTVFEISLTPNLGHCTSLIGVARELAAANRYSVIMPSVNIAENSSVFANELITIDIQNPENCPRYTCRIIKGVKIGSSPDWLKKRLESSGFRSINNVVDVTNYVMLELGHPLHAFDADLVVGKKIIVRNAKPNELIVTLDGKERSLDQKDLLVCDCDKAIALAGIMGSINSEVTEKTVNLLIEAAYFAPTCIRKTSKRLGLQTDASKRFERGTDPNILQMVLDRAAMLIQKCAGGEIAKNIVEKSFREFHKKQIECRLSRVNKILGTHLSVGEVEDIFRSLDMQTSWDGQDNFSIKVPTFRNDLQEEIDLIEEVARIYGFENINKSSSFCQPSKIPHAPIFIFEREIRRRLIAEGLQELLTCDLIGPTILNTIQEIDTPENLWVKVLNPTSIEQSILRTTLLPGLLQVVKYNRDHQNSDIPGFEIGRIHFKDRDQYQEQSVAAIVLSGSNNPYSWDSKPKEYDFFDLKGILENLLLELRIPDFSFEESQLKTLHPGRQSSIFSGSLKIGSFGEVHPAILRRLDVSQRVLFAEINLQDLLKVKPQTNFMQEIPLYPGSDRDWTLTLNEVIPIKDVFNAIENVSSLLLENVFLIDIYRSEKLGSNLKNVTLRFQYRDKKKTIAQLSVDAEHLRITESVLHSIKNLASPTIDVS